MRIAPGTGIIPGLPSARGNVIAWPAPVLRHLPSRHGATHGTQRSPFVLRTDGSVRGAVPSRPYPPPGRPVDFAPVDVAVGAAAGRGKVPPVELGKSGPHADIAQEWPGGPCERGGRPHRSGARPAPFRCGLTVSLVVLDAGPRDRKRAGRVGHGAGDVPAGGLLPGTRRRTFRRGTRRVRRDRRRGGDLSRGPRVDRYREGLGPSTGCGKRPPAMVQRHDQHLRPLQQRPALRVRVRSNGL